MVTNTPRKKGAASGAWNLSGFTGAGSGVNGGSNGHHKSTPGEDEKDAFVPKTTGDVFAPRYIAL